MQEHDYFQARIKNLQEQLDALNCNHEITEVRYVIASNGRKMFKPQCLRCGESIGDWLKYSDIENIEDIKPRNKVLWDNYRKNRVEMRIALNERKRNLERDQGYNEFTHRRLAYMKTPEWQERRRAVWKRCGGICEGCGKRPVKDIHHLTYDHLGNEFLFELVGLCRECHNRIHSLNDEVE